MYHTHNSAAASLHSLLQHSMPDLQNRGKQLSSMLAVALPHSWAAGPIAGVRRKTKQNIQGRLESSCSYCKINVLLTETRLQIGHGLQGIATQLKFSICFEGPQLLDRKLRNVTRFPESQAVEHSFAKELAAIGKGEGVQRLLWTN